LTFLVFYLQESISASRTSSILRTVATFLRYITS